MEIREPLNYFTVPVAQGGIAKIDAFTAPIIEFPGNPVFRWFGWAVAGWIDSTLESLFRQMAPAAAVCEVNHQAEGGPAQEEQFGVGR